MNSPRFFLAVAIFIGTIELVVWRGTSPESFERTFDRVERHELEIIPAEIELGDLALGEVKRASIRVTNTRDRKIQLRQPQSSCGCIRFTLDQPVTLQPGETTTLSLDFRAPRAPGPVQKNILLRVATADSAWRIPLKCRVVADSWASPAKQDVVIKKRKQGVLHFTTGSEIGDVVSSHPDQITVTLGKPSANAQTYQLQVNAEVAGEGYVAFFDLDANSIATVPIRWRQPSVIGCSPEVVVLDPSTLRSKDICEFVVIKDADKTKDLHLESKVPWVRIKSRENVSDGVVRFSVVVDRRKSPHRFSGEIVRVSDAKSGQSVKVKARI